MEATGCSRVWVQQSARRYNTAGPEALCDSRNQNPGDKHKALLDPDQQRELVEELREPPEDGAMWNSIKAAHCIEARTGKAASKQRG